MDQGKARPHDKVFARPLRGRGLNAFSCRNIYAQISLFKCKPGTFGYRISLCHETGFSPPPVTIQNTGVEKGRGAKARESATISTLQTVVIAGSSSGRMRLSGSRHLGSNPSPAAQLVD